MPDTRRELLAFATVSVLARVIHDGIEPTFEMFRTSAPESTPERNLSGEVEGDEDQEPAGCDLTTWRAGMARGGFSTYFEG